MWRGGGVCVCVCGGGGGLCSRDRGLRREGCVKADR